MTDTVDQTHQPTGHNDWPLLKRIQNEWQTLFKLGFPILIGQLAQMSNGVIDTVMAGRASADDLTGVAIGNSLWVPLFLFVIGLISASQPLISGHHGAKQHQHILPVTWNASYIALAFALVTVILLFNADQVLNLIGLEENPARICDGYLEAFALGIPAIFLSINLRGLTDGLGHTRIFMVFAILSACINTPLNYIFIFGKFGLPALGGVGCGWATAISSWLTFLTILAYLHFAKDFKSLHLWRHRQWPNRERIKEIFSLGTPVGFTMFVESLMFAAVALLIAPFGAATVAGHQIAINVVSVMFMVPLSLGTALTIRISFLIGAQQPSTARLVARSAILLVLAVAIVFASFLWMLAKPIAEIYSTEAAVIAVAASLLLYGAMFQIADVMQVVCISALRGYKDTRIPMYIMVLSFWGIGIPLGYVLAFKDWLIEPMGVAGFWVGMISSLSHAAAWLLIRLFWRSGK